MKTRKNLTKEKSDEIPPKSVLWRNALSVRAFRWIVLGPILALLLLGHGFAAEWWEVPPRGQPAQIWSRVDYDPKLIDPFFESNEWGFSRGGQHHPSRYSATRKGDGKIPAQDTQCSKHSAMCFSSSFGVWHPVNLCEAKLIDEHTIELLIHETNPAFRDALRVLIRNGKFSCQYWGLEGIRTFTWTTTRQKLTLDEKVYGKSAVIKGRIDFECVTKVIDPKNIERWGKDPTTVTKLFGVFKTIVE